MFQGKEEFSLKLKSVKREVYLHDNKKHCET